MATGFEVHPKINCPHWEKAVKPENVIDHITKYGFQNQCANCKSQSENWICLTCLTIFCSRYVSGHMVKHNEENPEHSIGMSLLDLSYWCYGCNDYIISKQLSELRKFFEEIREKYMSPDTIRALVDGLAKVELSVEKEEKKENTCITYKELVEGLKSSKFKKICVMTGAGISVAAGIPDFRTPGTGLYDQLQKYDLPFPEAIFTLNYFAAKPEPFYLISKTFLETQAKPTITHYFIKLLNDKGLLDWNLTQNIDGLELEAGLPEEKLVQAHGHFRTARCFSCKVEVSMELFKEHVKLNKILMCTKCDKPVKPDIVFFQEALPDNFFKNIQRIEEADLLIVMGTSLKVEPVASLALSVRDSTPIVYLNKVDEIKSRLSVKALVLLGDCDSLTTQLAKDCGWEADLKSLTPKL